MITVAMLINCNLITTQSTVNREELSNGVAKEMLNIIKEV